VKNSGLMVLIRAIKHHTFWLYGAWQFHTVVARHLDVLLSK
jgi:hypothetical protein